MFVVPLIGVPTLLYRGRGIDFGLFQVLSPFVRDPQIYRPLTESHEIAAYALVLLAAGHALAAIYHHVILKDRLMLRMMRPPSP
jgi:cytochrome b561